MTENEIGTADQRIGPGGHLANGWLLPLHVSLRPDSPAGDARAAERKVLLSSSMAFGLALVSTALGFSTARSSSTAPGMIGIAAALVAAFDLIVLIFTVRSIHLGMPRPSLDRPAFLIGAYVAPILCVFVVLSASGGYGHLSGWDIEAVAGLLALLASFGANAWWMVESSKRWKLFYEWVAR